MVRNRLSLNFGEELLKGSLDRRNGGISQESIWWYYTSVPVIGWLFPSASPKLRESRFYISIHIERA